ncbi:MAG: ATP-binding protein, partial [Kiritimatiellae bacterium]|nr:ATP-binding protein [Kiritimatiellia bacterium]
ALSDQKGVNVTYSGDRSFFEYHRDHPGRGMRVERPVPGRVTGRWYIPMSMRLEDASGNFAGVLLASVNPFHFSVLFRELDLGEDALVYLTDEQGVIYSGMLGLQELDLNRDIPPVHAAALFNQDSAYQDPEVNRSVVDGVRRIRSVAFFPGRRMLVSVAVSLKTCLGAWRIRTWFLLTAQALFSILILYALLRLRKAIRVCDLYSSELDQFFLTSLDLLCIANTKGEFVRLNREWENTLGFTLEELERHSFLDFVHPDDLQATLDAITKLSKQEAVLNFTNRYRRHDGTYRYLEWRSMPRGSLIYASARDITERIGAEEEQNKLRAQLAHAQKMESVGRLAGGVAHDNNNMLQAILGNVEMAMDQLKESDTGYAELMEIRRAAERSANLTQQLLAFARKQTVVPRVMELNRAVEATLSLMRRLIGEDIDLAWLPSEDVWPVCMDPTQVDQILANLCVNARDAISGVGKITIETGNRTFDEEYCATHAGYLQGDYVKLVVSDNGAGMNAETQARLFEPFFTTKVVGKGTGLGLATVYGIVRQNKGFVQVYSEPDQGTAFHVYLPRCSGAAEKDPAECPPAISACGVETILLVEDEPSILHMTSAMLRRLDYEVLAAGTTDEALNLADSYKGRIHLLMTDVIMPDMNGRDLAGVLMAAHPDMKCLFMSGYTADVIAHHGTLKAGVHFIQKPFSKMDLAAKVRAVLES